MNANEESAVRKPFTIIVNGRKKEWAKNKISFKEVVILAFGTYEENEQIVYTVSYETTERPPREGSMVVGDEVKVSEGMIFNVARSDKS